MVTVKLKRCKQVEMMTKRISYCLWIVEQYPQNLVNNYNMNNNVFLNSKSNSFTFWSWMGLLNEVFLGF